MNARRGVAGWAGVLSLDRRHAALDLGGRPGRLTAGAGLGG
jgi:hypothetical protein